MFPNSLKVLVSPGLLVLIGSFLFGQSQPNRHPLVLASESYVVRQGESVIVSTDPQSVAFARASRLTVLQGGAISRLVLGPNGDSTKLLLAAPLTLEPGTYRVSVSAAAESGEERSSEITVTIQPLEPVPALASRPPVVLLNGWQAGLTSSCPIAPSSKTFGPLWDQLLNDGVPGVYFFDNCVECPNCKIEDLGNRLGQVLNQIRYSDGTAVPKFDLIAHSMGGLIARSYLSGLQNDGTLIPPLSPHVRKFIQIATPNFGSFMALLNDVQSTEMVPGSPFLWNLGTWNQRGDDLRGIDAIAIIGNADGGSSDGVVSVTSASLGFTRNVASTRILPYCHKTFNLAEYVVFPCFQPGIAETDKAPETWQIIRSFLTDTPTWKTIGATPAIDPWLSQFGGMYFASQTASQQWMSDLTGASFGTVVLNKGGAQGVFYHEFIRGAGSFSYRGPSAGSFTCGPVTQPTGFYTAWRCKSGPIIFSVGQQDAGSQGKVVLSGGTVTIDGVGFGPSRCSGCSVFAYPGPVPLQISSWSDQLISAFLPGSFSGLVQLGLVASNGSDSINLMVAPPAIPPSLVLSTNRLGFEYVVGGSIPPSQAVNITNGGGGTLSWSASTNASWISTASVQGNLTVAVSPASLGSGSYSGTVTVTAPGATNAPQTIVVTLIVTAPAVVPTVVSIGNAASGVQGRIAPGEMVTIKGTGLGPATGLSFTLDSAGMVSTTLAGVRVFFGDLAAPITYASATQVNAIVPYEIDGQTQTVARVEYLGTRSSGASLQVGATSPGIFTMDSSGSGQALAINQDGTLNGPSNPAARGSYVTVYFTGGGITNPPGLTGSVTGSVLKWFASKVSVTVGGQSAEVSFAGAAPALIDGVGQLNIRLLESVAAGRSQPIVLSSSDSTSPVNATISVF